jgi:predicted nucleic acid-binding protein
LRRDRARDNPIVFELERLIRGDEIQMIGPIRQELLSGVQPQERFDQLREYLEFYPNLVLDEEDDETAAAFHNLCRKRGVQGASTDFLICAVTARRGLKIFTIDRDFERYARHLPIALHRARI